MNTGEKTLMQSKTKTLYQVYEIVIDRFGTNFNPVYWYVSYFDKRLGAWTQSNRFNYSRDARQFYRTV
jgi:hypothetical protein